MSVRRVTMTVVATALAGSLLPGGGASASAGPSVAAPTPSTVVVATYNIRHSLSDDAAASDVQRLAAAGVDVIGLQEMGSGERRSVLRKRLVDCTTCEFSAFTPSGSGPAAVPILYRTSKFSLVSQGTQLISPATYVGPDGAGPSTVAPKSLNYVQLRHRVTGQPMYVINSHAVASVQAADGGPNYDHPERLALYRQHMAALSAMVTTFKATGAAVFTTGDFNVNYRRDSVVQSKMFPYHTMKNLGVFASYRSLGVPSTGTHVADSGNDTRIIDYVSSLDHAAVVPTAQSILGGYRSDHRPVTVRYTIATAPGAPTEVSAIGGERSATVSWKPAPSHGQPVQNYTVTTVESGTTTVVDGASSSAVVPGLVPGRSYTFVVEATSRAGAGPESLPSGAVTPYAAPPQTSITAGPTASSFVASTTALFRYASSAPGSTFTCEVDGTRRTCGGSSLALKGLSRSTHTVAVAAQNEYGDQDRSPASRSWTVPLAASDLSRTSAWSLRTSRDYYTGQYLAATRKSATLTRRVSGAHALALVATRGRGHGTVHVYLGSTLLKRVALDSAGLSRTRVVPIARFSGARTGTVRIVVASSGRPVRIEGLGVSTQR